MKKTRFLFISLSIQDGEREHTHGVLHQTKCEHLDFAVQYYAAHFWGYSYLLDGAWYAWGGEIAIEVDHYKEIDSAVYSLLHNLFYNNV